MGMIGVKKIKYLQAFFAALLLAAAYLPGLGHAACGTTKTVKKAGGGDYASIAAAITGAQAASPLPGDWCINIDSAVYSEQVTVQNITFTYSTNTLTFQTDPSLISTQATINPPSGSTAAFQIMNPSVTLQNILVVLTNAVSYGVYASSAYVTVSSVTIGDNVGRITMAGVVISSYSSVLLSSITVQNAHGLYTSGTLNTISNSTVSTNGVGYSLYLNGASSNTITGCLISSETRLDSGASYNTIKLSTLTTNSAANYSLHLVNAPYNLITQDYISNIDIFTGSTYNTVSWSTMTGVLFDTISTNTMTQDLIIGLTKINFGDHITIQSSTMTINSSGGPALYLFSTQFNTISGNYIGNTANFSGRGVQLWGNSAYNTISGSTISANGWGIDWQASSNTLSRSFVTSLTFDGLLFSGANNNTVSQSTITALLDGYYPIRLNTGFANSILNSYMQGSTAVYVSGSTGTIITGSILVATNTTGSGVWMTGGSMNLTLTTNTFNGGPQGAGIFIDPGNSGSIAMTSNTITTARWGVYISTMNCGGTCTGANLSISSMVIQGPLTVGATAIYFAGGTFVSTFSGVNFTDPNTAVNVNGAPLSYGAVGSRITLSGYSGAKAGPSFENDPNSVIDWISNVNLPPSNPVISPAQVFITSVTVNYGITGATGYEVDASTASNFSGTLYSAIDLTGSLSSLSPQGLATNTTYYLRVGALWSGTTFYANTTPSYAVTLASTPAPLSFSGVGLTQFTVNWPANGNPTNTLYQVDVSTDINFGLIQTSSSTTNLAVTFSPVATLTIYYVRVRAFNFAGVPTAYALGAVETINGVVTISGDHLKNLWYSNAFANFTAQEAPQPQPWLFHYTITSSPSSPLPSDPIFNGSALTVTLNQGVNYFNVLGRNAADTVTIGTATWGPILVDTGAPVVASIAAQNSPTDTTPILNGGTTLSNTPRLKWPVASSTSPVVGYSLSFSTDPAAVPGVGITTTINFSDQILTKSGLYYAKVAALNLAGNLGPFASMSFTYTSVPSVSGVIIKSNYFNPLRGECTQVNVRVASGGHLKLEIYNLLGQKVVSLADQDAGPGTYNYSWCGKNASGEWVATGGYFLHVEAPDQRKNFKVIVGK